jgi:hypothetical protein
MAKRTNSKPGLKLRLKLGECFTVDGPATVIREKCGQLRVIASKQVRIVPGGSLIPPSDASQVVDQPLLGE